MASKKTTPAQVGKMIKKWKEILGLQHWVIHADLVEAEELLHPDEGLTGQITSRPSQLDALLSVAIHRGRDAVETTVAHELCHVLISPLDCAAELLAAQLSGQAQALHKIVLQEHGEALATQLGRTLLRLARQEES